MVECTALEMRHRCKPIGGSNPSLSATLRPSGYAWQATLVEGSSLLSDISTQSRRCIDSASLISRSSSKSVYRRDGDDPAASRACPSLRSPPSTRPVVAQGDSLAGTRHTVRARRVVSNTPAFRGRASSPGGIYQTDPRGLIADKPLRKSRFQQW